MNATATIAPTGPQYMRALERANKVRLARAELKRKVAIGELDVGEVILGCPWEAHSMAVADLLMSQRRWGQTRCRKFLAQIPMSEKKTVGSMTERQRHTLASLLHGGAAARPLALDAEALDSDGRAAARPLAKGQPDDSLSCHQPASMPIRPSRGRTSHTPQLPCPRSRTAQAPELVAARFQAHLIEQLVRPSLVLDALGHARAQLLKTPRELVADLLELCEIQQSGTRVCAAAPEMISRSRCEREPVGGRMWGKPSATIAASSRSSRATWARSERRAASSSICPSRGDAAIDDLLLLLAHAVTPPCVRSEDSTNGPCAAPARTAAATAGASGALRRPSGAAKRRSAAPQRLFDVERRHA